MYYFQVEEFQQSCRIYKFGRHFLTRLQLNLIVAYYRQQISELEKFNALVCPEFIGLEEVQCWDNLRVDFERGYNINGSKWHQQDLQLLRVQINREINLLTPKPIPVKQKTIRIRHKALK